MAYFANGSEGRTFEAQFCEHCIHGQDPEKYCPVMELHEQWNYDQCGTDPVSVARKIALDTFITDEDGYNCKMFKQTVVPDEEPDFRWHDDSELKPLVSR